MFRLRDLDRDFIRAIARVRFTDLVGECSRSGPEVVVELSVVGCRPDDNTISQYVHGAAISRPPSQLHSMVGSLGLRTRLELNRSRRRRRRSAAYRPVEPVNLIGIHASNTEYLSYPIRATTNVTPRISECRSRISLHHPVSPLPLTLRSESHIGLDLYPIGASSQNRRDGQVYRERGADYRDRLVERAENLSARKSTAVGVNENIPIGGRSRALEVPPSASIDCTFQV